MLFQVTHVTQYSYEAPVSQCINEVRLTPRSLATQKVLQTGLTVEPSPVFLHQRRDYFGTDVTTSGVFEMHDRFMATASSIVETQPANTDTDSPLQWEEA